MIGFWEVLGEGVIDGHLPKFMLPSLYMCVGKFTTFDVFEDWVGFAFEGNSIECECC